MNKKLVLVIDLMVGGWVLMMRMFEQLQSSSTSADTAWMWLVTCIKGARA